MIMLAIAFIYLDWHRIKGELQHGAVNCLRMALSPSDPDWHKRVEDLLMNLCTWPTLYTQSDIQVKQITPNKQI